MVEGENVKSGIGGWLIFPAIGCVLGPMLALVSFALGLHSIPESGTLRSIAGFELWCTGLLAIFLSGVAYLFFRKEKAAPDAFVIYLQLSIASTVILFVLLALTLREEVIALIARPIFATFFGVVWILYFRRSKRVKATFVNPARPQPNYLEGTIIVIGVFLFAGMTWGVLKAVL